MDNLIAFWWIVIDLPLGRSSEIADQQKCVQYHFFKISISDDKDLEMNKERWIFL